MDVVGLEGEYQNILFMIIIFTGFLPCFYYFQVPYLTKNPNFLVKKLKSENPNQIYEMEFSPELCDSTLYEIQKDPKTSVINWSYTYDLYCQKEGYNTIITSLIFVGGSIGILMISPLPDKYGRANVLKYITIISLILHLNLLFITGPNHLILINFFGGIFSSILNIGFGLFTEFFPKNKNGFYIGIYNALFPLLGILLCIFFYFSNSWRLLYFITSTMHAYYTFITWKYMIESPRWLHSIGNKEKCIWALTEISFYNKRVEDWNNFQKNNKELINRLGTPFLELEENNSNINNLKENIKINKTYNILDILRLKSQRKIFIKLTINSICSSYNYYGIILNLGKMKGNFYLNSIFAFLGELIAEFLTGFYSDKFGRIKILIISCIIGTFGYISYIISPSFKFIFIFIAMLGYSGILNTNSIYAPEIYPTKIRNIMSSASSFLSRIGPICVPIFSQKFPNLIDYSFVISGIVIGLIGSTLEETLGMPRKDIIPEEEYNDNLKNKLLNK